MENKEDLYVIGFPKSGNTWLARLLSDITNSKIYVESDDDKVNSSENSDDKNGNYLIHKIHATKEIERVKKAKKVYIVRDPRDVFVSGFFHLHRGLSEKHIVNNYLYRYFFNLEVRMLNNCWNKNFIRTLRNFLRYKEAYNPPLRVGNWSEHVQYWTELDDVVEIKYEDLLENTKVELEKILNQMNIKYSDELLSEAVYNQSFSKKKQEFLEKEDQENAKFMRSGKKESWRKLLDKNLQYIIEKRHRKVMNDYGYITEQV